MSYQRIVRPFSSDAVEEAQFRARMARMAPDPMSRPIRARRPGSRDGGGGGLKLGWKSWLAIDCAVVLLIVVAVVAWPPVQACRDQDRTVGFYAGDSVNQCIRRGIAERLGRADQRMKMLLRGSGH